MAQGDDSIKDDKVQQPKDITTTDGVDTTSKALFDYKSL
jgi:hypothetical protein